MKHIKSFNLFEKLTDVNIDVDMIYDKYFREGIEYINETDKLDTSLFKRAIIYSEELTSPLCIEANKINPIEILINVKNNATNHYNPFENLINLHVNYNAINYVSNFRTLTDAINDLVRNEVKKSLKNTFNESSIKGSIHHELVHWIDDSLNSQHIVKKLNKAREKNIPLKNVNYMSFEIQTQIHNIVQLKRKYEDVWDTLTFNEMIELSPPLSVVMNNIDSIDKNNWIKRLKQRMSREGLLGKNMYNN
jgi:hypothetical protein